MPGIPPRYTQLLLALCLFSVRVVSAEPLPYMLKDEPNTLYCMASVGDTCPLTNDEVQALIDDVMRRFTLSRLDKSTTHEPMLYVEVYCHAVEGMGGAYSVEAGFAEWIGRTRQHLMKYAYYPYKSIGFGDKETLREAVGRRIEDALSDYLTANFPPARDHGHRGATGAEDTNQ